MTGNLPVADGPRRVVGVSRCSAATASVQARSSAPHTPWGDRHRVVTAMSDRSGLAITRGKPAAGARDQKCSIEFIVFRDAAMLVDPYALDGHRMTA